MAAGDRTCLAWHARSRLNRGQGPIQAVDPRPSLRVQTFRHVDHRNTVLADAHPLNATGQYDPFEARPNKAPVRHLEIDPQTIG